MKRPYVIVAPPFATFSGGVRVLYELCAKLQNLGYDAYMSFSNHPHLKSIHDLNEIECARLQHEGIIVYPEIVKGNPCCFNNVVRWDLAPHTNVYLDHYLVFSFSKLFGHEPFLHLYYIEDFFCPPEEENRSFITYWVGKIPHPHPIPELTGAIQITATNPPVRTTLAKLLQRSRLFYTYDNITGLILEAQLCGCPVIIIPSNQVSKESLKKYHGVGFEGIAFYDESHSYESLKEEIKVIPEKYKNHIQTTERAEIENFIALTQSLDCPYVEDYIEPEITFHPWLGTLQFGRRTK